MCSEILLSVIVPVYKIPLTRLKALFTLFLNNKSQLIEFIIVDDGSPDQCGNYCDIYHDLDSRFNVYHTENKGVSSARNFGIMHSKGEYITFIDADDLVKADTLENLLNTIKIFDYDVIFFGYQKIDENTPFYCKTNSIDNIVNLTCNQIIWYIISQLENDKRYLFGSPWGKLFKLSFLRRNSIFFPCDIKYSEDRIFMVNLLSFSPTLYFEKYDGYLYVKRIDSVSRLFKDDLLVEYKNTYDYMSKIVSTNFTNNVFFDKALIYMKYRLIEDYIRALLKSDSSLINKLFYFRKIQDYNVSSINVKLLQSRFSVLLYYILKYSNNFLGLLILYSVSYFIK